MEQRSVVSPHYAVLEQLYENGTVGWVEATLGDILTLAATHDPDGRDEALTDIASAAIALEKSEDFVSDEHTFMVFQSHDALGVTILFKREQS